MQVVQLSVPKMKEYILTNHMNIQNHADKIKILNLIMKYEYEYNVLNETDLKLVIDEKNGIRIHLNELEKINPEFVISLYNLIHFIINNKEVEESPELEFQESDEDI